MLSRVADAIYWCSRYVERAENVARFVDVNLNLMLDTPVQKRDDWAALVLTTGDQDWYWSHYDAATPQKVTRFLIFDPNYPNSILSTLSRARENAQTVREIISREMWHALNEFYLFVRDASTHDFSLDDMAEFYAAIMAHAAEYQGVSSATLSRGEACHWSRFGQFLERADKTSRILDVKYYILLPTVTEVGTTVDLVGWTALLDSASALQMYRQLHNLITPEDVASFLLFDRAFPRSIHYCIHRAEESLHYITGNPLDLCSSEAERQTGLLRAKLDFDRPGDVLRSGLHEYIQGLQLLINGIGAATQRQFFDRWS